MPQSSFFNAKINDLISKYNRVFPASVYPGTCEFVTHITPDEERMKKLYLVFPGRYKPTYSGLPALVVTAHQHNGSKTSLRVRVTNLITGTTKVLTVQVSKTSRGANHSAMDKIINMLRRQMWSVGPAVPDHYAE